MDATASGDPVWFVGAGWLTAQEKLVTLRLGIAGMPENLDDILGLCAQLDVEPVHLLGPGESPPRPLPQTVVLPRWDAESCASAARGESLTGLWAGSCTLAPIVGEASSALGLPCLPCLDEAQQAAIPIEGATVYPFSALASLSDSEIQRLPIPAWVRAACTRGDSSCMRLEHPNDLPLASAKLQKRNTGGPLRIQPVIEGPVYRLLAFKTGESLAVAGLIAEDMTSSVYRVPLGMSLPVTLSDALLGEAHVMAGRVNALLPKGWGYVEMEFVDTGNDIRLIDVQCPASLDPHLRQLVWLSQGIDLRLAAMACALGRVPALSPTHNTGAAMMWLLARSGVVIGFQGIEEARAMPGIVGLHIVAAEGDILSHVVDIPSRERGGYIIATGDTAAMARDRLEAARAQARINTSPALV